MKNFYFLIIALGTIIITSVKSFGQMVGTDVFLQGHYVEVGTGIIGYYGSGAAPPAGYHPHGVTNLGFVADPFMTGWSTSTTTTTSHYYGDFFYPGTPFEGWELQVDGMRCQAFNMGFGTFSYSGGMPTATISGRSWANTAHKLIGTIQVDLDSITLIQTTKLDTNNFYFTVHIELINNGVLPKNNIYYLRNLDPDNDQSWPGGSFKTLNKIEHQMPSVYDASVVSAKGTVIATAYLALGTPDTASRVYIGTWPMPLAVDLATVYNETWGAITYTEGTSFNGDVGIGLVIKVPHLATVDSAGDSVYRTTALGGSLHPANTASFTFFYAFGQSDVDSAINAIRADTPHVPTTFIKNAKNTSDVNVYPNPAKELINITGLENTDFLALYDMMGREMDHNWIIKSQRVNTFSIKDIPSGNYVLKIINRSGQIKAIVPLKKGYD